LEAALRILGCFFNEGPNFLFQVALAMLKTHYDEILSNSSSESIIVLLKDSIYNTDSVLQLACTDFESLPLDKINELRYSATVDIIQNMETFNKKRALRDFELRTKFSRGELDQMYSWFQGAVRLNSAGDVISSKLFHEIMVDSTLTPEWRHRPDLINMTFKVLDEDEDDNISLDEFLVGISALCKGTLTERFSLCFRMHDSDKDGSLNREQFYNCVEGLLSVVQPPHTQRGIQFQRPTTDVRNINGFVSQCLLTVGRPDEPNTLVSCGEIVEVAVKGTLFQQFFNFPPEAC